MPFFGNIFFTVVIYIFVLLIIVFVHEMGHYLVGRWTGIKAKVFSVGMGKPVLWSREDKHGTVWQIAAWPIGGYVKFVGDANAASAGAATSELSPEERRHSLTFAPLWARVLTVAAGPVFNFIFAAIVFMVLMFVTGVQKQPLTVGEVSPRAPSGLMPGDVVLEIAGQKVPVEDESWSDFYDRLPVESADVDYKVDRGGNVLDVTAPHPLPALVGTVGPLSAARDAGIEVGDWIVAIDGTPLPTFDALLAYMSTSTGAPVTLTVRRMGEPEPLTLTMTPKLTDTPRPEGGFQSRYLIGIGGDLSFTPEVTAPGLWQALSSGVRSVGGIGEATVSGLYNMATGKISACNMTGPVRIAQIVAQKAEDGVEDFIWLIALLSAAIGFMNLLPIPVLDGGHLVFYAYEAVARRRPGERVYNVLTMIGLVAMLSLFVFSTMNDFICP